MKNWKVGTRITLGFAAVIVLTLLFGIFAFDRMRVIERNADDIAKNNVPAVIALGHIQTELYHVVELLLQHAASSDQHEMDGLEAQMTAIHEKNAKAYQSYESLSLGPGELALYEKVKADRNEFWRVLDEVRKTSRLATAAGNAQAKELTENQLKPVLQKYVDDLQAVLDLNNNGSRDGLALVHQSGSAANWGITIGLVLVIGIAIPITILIVRSIAGPLAQTVAALELVARGDLTPTVEVRANDELGQLATAMNTALEKLKFTMNEVLQSADHSNASSQELAGAAQAIASGAQQQAASLEQTSASLEQITAAVRQTADNARQASQLATGSRESAEKGEGVVSSAIAAMAEINTASAKISDIISTINEIAFQTNLLAVNAAVEAARAGEEGRGFAVVATEVRSLAQRSAEAAKEIKSLIQDSLDKVEKGTELVNRSGATLQGIVSSVKRVTDIVGEIAAASGEQSTGVEQVNTAITQMDHVTQSNSAQTETLAATAQGLAAQAAGLLQLVGTFQLGGDSERARNGHGQQPAPQSRRPPSPAAGRTAARPGPRAGNNRGSSPSNGRKEVAAAPALVGSSVSGSDDASFEEF